MIGDSHLRYGDRMSTTEMTPEEAILELRKIVKAFTGMDPREGQVAKPIKAISEEDAEKFVNALFVRNPKVNE